MAPCPLDPACGNWLSEQNQLSNPTHREERSVTSSVFARHFPQSLQAKSGCRGSFYTIHLHQAVCSHQNVTCEFLSFPQRGGGGGGGGGGEGNCLVLSTYYGGCNTCRYVQLFLSILFFLNNFNPVLKLPDRNGQLYQHDLLTLTAIFFLQEQSVPKGLTFRLCWYVLR